MRKRFCGLILILLSLERGKARFPIIARDMEKYKRLHISLSLPDMVKGGPE